MIQRAETRDPEDWLATPEGYRIEVMRATGVPGVVLWDRWQRAAYGLDDDEPLPEAMGEPRVDGEGTFLSETDLDVGYSAIFAKGEALLVVIGWGGLPVE